MMKQFSYRHTKEAELMDSMERAAKGAPQTDEELFSFAGFNEAEVERTGYSNYSYWSSTFRAASRSASSGGMCGRLILY